MRSLKFLLNFVISYLCLKKEINVCICVCVCVERSGRNVVKINAFQDSAYLFLRQTYYMPFCPELKFLRNSESLLLSIILNLGV